MRDPYPDEGGERPSSSPVLKGILIALVVIVIAAGVCTAVVLGG